jgi:hypothetical protein
MFPDLWPGQPCPLCGGDVDWFFDDEDHVGLGVCALCAEILWVR